MATMNLYDAEEVSYESTIIPDGTIVACTIVVKKVKTNDNGNRFMEWEMIVKEGQYKGSKFFETVGIAGSDGFVRLGKSKMKAVLESGRNATKPSDYEVDTQDIGRSFNGLIAIVRVKLEGYFNKDGEWRLKNTVHSYGSPNPTSSRHDLYLTYRNGEQPYQNSESPQPPAQNTRAASAPAYGSASYGNDQHSDMPAYATEYAPQ